MKKKNESFDSLNNLNIFTKEDWIKFKQLFEKAYNGFFDRLHEKFPGLTPAEIRLVCLTKLKFNTNQMADILGVSTETINKTRYRLRKKVKIPRGKSIDDIIDLI
jgi:hypothetical protein